MAGWHHWCNGHELGQTSGDGEGQGGLACCSSWGCKKSDTAVWLRDNNKYQCLRLVGSQVVLYSPSLFCLLLYSDLKIINKNYELHMWFSKSEKVFCWVFLSDWTCRTSKSPASGWTYSVLSRSQGGRWVCRGPEDFSESSLPPPAAPSQHILHGQSTSHESF